MVTLQSYLKGSTRQKLEMTVGCSHSWRSDTLAQSTVPAGRVTMTLLSQGSGWSMVPENRMEGFWGGLLLLLLLLLSRFSHVRLCETPQTAAYQAPPSLGFSRQEHWSGLPVSKGFWPSQDPPNNWDESPKGQRWFSLAPSGVSNTTELLCDRMACVWPRGDQEC